MNENDTPIERPDFGVRRAWYADIVGSWPQSSMETTSVEALEAQARAQETKDEDERFARFAGENTEAGSSATDAQPQALDFFNGRPYAEGVKLYNEYLASRGRK